MEREHFNKKKGFRRILLVEGTYCNAAVSVQVWTGLLSLESNTANRGTVGHTPLAPWCYSEDPCILARDPGVWPAVTLHSCSQPGRLPPPWELVKDGLTWASLRGHKGREGGREEGGREEAPGCGSLDIPASPICQSCGPLLLSQGSFGNCVC